jgi:ABC-2 type transport system permease protein
MAVYEHTYRQYDGPRTPEWSRFLIIPRHAYRSIFGSKLFIALFVGCFIYPLIASIFIYLHHNTNAMAIMRVTVGDLVPIDADFFRFFIVLQGTIGYFLNVLIGPPLISRDLANNALPLYLCRPFSRTEYVLGKMSVVMILLSLMTWIPGLLLFFFQAYLEGGGWLWQNLHVAGAMLIGSFIWITLLALMSQAVSALFKWRIMASAALVGIYFIPAALGQIVNNIFFTRWGSLINMYTLIGNIWSGLFGTFVRQTGSFRGRINGQRMSFTMLEPPLWCNWLVLAVLCGLCLYMLVRKVRAYEVVR